MTTRESPLSGSNFHRDVYAFEFSALPEGKIETFTETFLRKKVIISDTIYKYDSTGIKLIEIDYNDHHSDLRFKDQSYKSTILYDAEDLILIKTRKKDGSVSDLRYRWDKNQKKIIVTDIKDKKEEEFCMYSLDSNGYIASQQYSYFNTLFWKAILDKQGRIVEIIEEDDSGNISELNIYEYGQNNDCICCKVLEMPGRQLSMETIFQHKYDTHGNWVQEDITGRFLENDKYRELVPSTLLRKIKYKA